MPAAEKKAAALYVTAQRVQAVTKGGKAVHLLKGDVVTDELAADSIEHLQGLGYISETSPFDGVKP